MNKIDLKDFKKIKKGSKVLYMGGQVEVLKNDGYVLTLKGKDGKKFTVNKAMFDHGGQINEGVLDNITLMADASKDYEDFKKKFKKGFPKIFKPTPDFMDWLYGMYKDMAPDKVEEGIVDDLVKMGAQIDYLYDADPKTQKIWKKAGFDPNDQDNIILYSYVNSWPETKKMLDKKRVKYKELEDPNSAGESYIVFKESVNENVNDASNNLEKIFGTDQETMDIFQGIEDKGTVKDMIEFIDEFGNEEMLSRYGIRSAAQVKKLAKTIMGESINEGIDFQAILLKDAMLKYNIQPTGGIPRTLQFAGKGYMKVPKGTFLIGLPGGLFAVNPKKKFAVQITSGSRAYLDAQDKLKDSDVGGTNMAPEYREWKQYLKESVNEAKLSAIHKAAKKGSYPVSIVATILGKVVKQELVKTPMAVPAAFNMMQGAYPKATISVESKTGQTLFVESINELNSDGAIMDLWKKLYGEDFVSEYPAVAKILKVNRKNIDRRELARIWDETYGEDLKDKYPDFFKALK